MLTEKFVYELSKTILAKRLFVSVTRRFFLMQFLTSMERLLAREIPEAH